MGSKGSEGHGRFAYSKSKTGFFLPVGHDLPVPCQGKHAGQYLLSKIDQIFGPLNCTKLVVTSNFLKTDRQII